VPFRKPHPSIFKLAVRRLELDPGEILFVGDHLSDDVAGAHGVGIPAAWVNRKRASSDGFHPDFELASLADLLTLDAHKVLS
jgi:2-haloacid dehalogenase/putative hydrolase of the HAD superfamily